MTAPHKGKIQFRRGSAAAWAAKNPVLASGEPAYETDTDKWKLGDDVTPYNDLPYMPSSFDAAVTVQDLQDHVDSEDPHPNYDDGRSFVVYYENAKV